MEFIIGNKKFESNKVKLITIDGKATLMGLASGIGRFWVTVKGDDGAEYNFDSDCYLEKATQKIASIYDKLKAQNMNNFLRVNNKFIINLDKIAGYDWQYNLKGYQYIWAKFKDGSEYALYHGLDEECAKGLYNALSEVQRVYAADKKTEKLVSQ